MAGDNQQRSSCHELGRVLIKTGKQKVDVGAQQVDKDLRFCLQSGEWNHLGGRKRG